MAVSGAINYTLSIGSTAGANDALNYTTAGQPNPGGVTSTTASLLPGTTYYATLSTLTSSGSLTSSSTFKTNSMGYLTTPLNGATGVSPYQLFSWTPVSGAQVYNLIVSPTGYGVTDNFNGDFTGTSSGYVWDLQPNTLYYVELYTQTTTGYATSYSTFTTGPGNPRPADRSGFYNLIKELTGQVRLMATTPGNYAVPGSFLYQNMANHWANPAINANCGNFATALADLLTQNGILSRRRITTFDGADVHVVAEYWDPFNSKWQIADATFGVMYLNPESQIGQGVEDLNSLLRAGNLSAITPWWATSSGTYYMTTFYMNPILYYNNPFPYGLLQNFQEVYDNVPNSPLSFLTPVSLDSPTPSPIGYYEFLFTNPTDQITINNAGSQITVSPLSSAGWALSVGLYPGWSITSTIPAGTQIYTPIWPSGFPFANASVLSSPTYGATVRSQNIQFDWTPVPGAIDYTLWIGSTPGAQDVLSYSTASTSNPSGATSATISLAPATTYYVTLGTLTSTGTAYAPSSVFTTEAGSYLTAPLSGQQNVPANATFQWTTSPGAQAYYLYVGTTQGAKDVVNTGAIQGTSYTVTTPLPAGATLWARLWTQLNGVWSYQGDISFTVSALSHLIAPLNGQQNVPANTTFQWTAAPGAQAYYLYVGTIQGAKDIVNTWHIQGTSYTVTTPLPAGVTLWARIWTEINGVWSYQSDISFTVSALSYLTAPANGQQNVPANATFQWTTSPGAQAYYLYVGTTQGAKDVVNTGAIQGTSYTATTPLPAGATLWARIWTQLNGVWSYQGDISFTVSALSHLTAPLNGQQNVPVNATFQWTTSPGAQAYYLYVGTTQGAKDVVNTEPIQGTSYTVTTPLPAGAMLWARIWTEINDTWSYQGDISFTVSALAYLTAPLNGQQNVPANATFHWTTSPGAQAYYLYVGTTQGAKDVVNTEPIQGTSYTVTTPLPAGATLWARIWTELNGVWNYQIDTTFQTAFAAEITSPSNGATNLDPAVPISVSWTPVAAASSYELTLGSSLGANNYYDSGAVSSASASVNLSPNTTYYARIRTNISGTLTYADSEFSTGYALAHLTYPLNGATGTSQFLPFTWTTAPGAKGYFLSVSPTGYGKSDFYWSAGSSLVPTDTSQYVYALQPNTTYYAEICTVDPSPAPVGCNYATFTTGGAPNPPTNQAQFYQTIISYTAQVNQMGQGLSHIPISGSALYDEVASYGGKTSSNTYCGDYVNTLLNLLAQNNILGRIRSISLDGPESHQIAEVWDPFNQQWDVADPFFGATYFNTSLTSGLSAEQISAFLLAGQYSQIGMEFVGSYGNEYMTSYYLDPMTFYTNVVPFGMITTYQELNTVPNSPTQFLIEVDLNDVGQAGFYVFNFQNQTDSVTIESGGNPITISPANTEGWAPSVYLQGGWTVTSTVPTGMRVFTFVRVMY